MCPFASCVELIIVFISGSLIFGNVYIILSNVNDFSNNNSKFIDVCGVTWVIVGGGHCC